MFGNCTYCMARKGKAEIISVSVYRFVHIRHKTDGALSWCVVSNPASLHSVLEGFITQQLMWATLEVNI